MALVVMCGQPRSGKSTVVRRLVQQLQEDLERGEAAAAGGGHGGGGGGGRLRVTVIDEASLNQGDRNASYKSMVQEKNLRGTLRSAVSRAVAKDCIVIVDSLNNIKGYRYELWCVARAAGIRYCVVYCRVSDDTPCLWNLMATVDSDRSQEEERKEGAAAATAYSQEILEDLLRRFEPPDSRNRWDSPLFELRLGPTPMPPSDDTSHLRDPWSGDSEEVVVQRIAEVSRHATGASSTDAAFRGRGGTSLQPTIATQTGRSSDASALYLVDRATQDVLAAIADAQNRAGDEAAGLTSLGPGLPPIDLRRRVGVAELQRHRRAYLRLAGQASLSGPRPPSDPLTCQRLFLEYLNRELE